MPSTKGPESLQIAMFRDATEIVWLVADYLAAHGLGAPPPQRSFVRDAEEVHQLCLEGSVPVVGMSLDDVLDCAQSGHPNASQVAAFYGVHKGFLSLMALPEFSEISSLKGRTIAVDTLSGYASGLFEILAGHGVSYTQDLNVILAGATNLRYEKLANREFEGTLLGTPYDILAAERGCNSFARVLTSLGGYQGVVFAAHHRWLDSHSQEVEGLLTTFSGALTWAQEAGNRQTLAGIVREGLPSEVSAEALERIVERLFGAGTEFNRGGHISASDANVVLNLFARYRQVDLSDLDLASVLDTRFLASSPNPSMTS